MCPHCKDDQQQAHSGGAWFHCDNCGKDFKVDAPPDRSLGTQAAPVCEGGAGGRQQRS